MPAPSPVEEANEVIRLEREFWEKAEQDVGTICYAIDGTWWRAWCAYTGLEIVEGVEASVKETEAAEPSPGSIDNRRLASTPISLLREGHDFTCKSPGTWQMFCQLYPMSGPEVALCVTSDGKIAEQKELYIHRSSDLRANPHVLLLHGEATLRDLRRLACNAFDLEEDAVQVFDYFNKRKQNTCFDESLLDCAITDTKVNLIDKNDVLLQEKVNGKCPEEERETASSSDTYHLPSFSFSRYSVGSSTDSVTQREGAKPGTAGLGNLGNTCFMNSSVQCLAHTIPLVRTFLSDAYKADLNRDNPLGNRGKLAEAFGEVMKKLWQENTGSVVPRHFKQQVASFNSSFAGYQQHDSQELLAFLLDGLHEDLNRVKQKPYIEIPDSNGRPDEELAEEAWRIYKARNDSFIADHFQGMYKSTLVCPECSYSSVTMETFNCLSLPLPSAKWQDIEVTVVSMDGTAPPTHYTAQVLRLGTVKDLYASIAKLCGIDPKQADKLLLLVETLDGLITSKLTDLDEPLADAIRPNSRGSLLAYKYSSADWGPSSGGKELHVFQRRKRKRRGFYRSDKELFAAPLLLWLPEDMLRSEDDSSTVPVDTLLQPNGLVSMAVETALRPFKRRKDAGAAAGDLPEIPRASGDMPSLPSAASLPRSGSRVVSEPDRLQAGSNLDSMDHDSASPPETPKGQLSPTTSPLGSPRANSFTSDSSQTSPPKAFDMFALQEPANVHGRADETQMDVDPEQPAYHISPTNYHGEQSRSLARLDDNELYFAIDWEASAAREYDPECMEAPQLHSSTEEARAKHDAGPKPFTLQECLEAFLEGERLEDSESWCCERCKKLVQAHKKLDLWDLPEVAVIHLKRFSYSSRFRDKIDRLVQFPVKGLNLQPAALKQQEVEPTYDLFAVSNHFGGLGGGHYTAYAKLNESEEWYCFDDSSTYTVQPKDVVTSAAYVLFYRRRQETLQDQGKSTAELIENSKSDSDWSDVVASIEGGEPDHANGVPVRLLGSAPEDMVSELDVDEPMQSLPGSPDRKRPVLDLIFSPVKQVGTQEMLADGLLKVEDTMNFPAM